MLRMTAPPPFKGPPPKPPVVPLNYVIQPMPCFAPSKAAPTEAKARPPSPKMKRKQLPKPLPKPPQHQGINTGWSNQALNTGWNSWSAAETAAETATEQLEKLKRLKELEKLVLTNLARMTAAIRIEEEQAERMAVKKIEEEQAETLNELEKEDAKMGEWLNLQGLAAHNQGNSSI